MPPITKTCPLCNTVFQPNREQPRFCSAECTELAALNEAFLMRILYMHTFTAAEFQQLLHDRQLQEGLRSAVWRQGELEFMVCEDFTLANIASQQIHLSDEGEVVAIRDPSGEWRTVLSDYNLIPLHIRSWKWTDILKLQHPWLLTHLLKDRNMLIRRTALRNPRLPITVLETYLTTELSPPSGSSSALDIEARIYLAQRPDTPSALLEQLAHSSLEVVKWVVRHPNTSLQTLDNILAKYTEMLQRGRHIWQQREINDLVALAQDYLKLRKNEPL